MSPRSDNILKSNTSNQRNNHSNKNQTVFIMEQINENWIPNTLPHDDEVWFCQFTASAMFVRYNNNYYALQTKLRNWNPNFSKKNLLSYCPYCTVACCDNDFANFPLRNFQKELFRLVANASFDSHINRHPFPQNKHQSIKLKHIRIKCEMKLNKIYITNLGR